jgi:CheY-like chemotaxis protein
MARAASRSLVLVVEDEPLLRMDAVDMIREFGFDVLEASNADEAILLLETRLDIELVFTDIDMPGSMNGIKAGPRRAKTMASDPDRRNLRTFHTSRRRPAALCAVYR